MLGLAGQTYEIAEIGFVTFLTAKEHLDSRMASAVDMEQVDLIQILQKFYYFLSVPILPHDLLHLPSSPLQPQGPSQLQVQRAPTIKLNLNVFFEWIYFFLLSICHSKFLPQSCVQIVAPMVWSFFQNMAKFAQAGGCCCPNSCRPHFERGLVLTVFT